MRLSNNASQTYLKPIDRRIKALRQSSMFRDIPDHQLHEIMPYVSESNYPHNAIIFQHGDACKKFSIIQEGTIILNFLSEAGRTSIIERATSGDIIGLVPCLDGEPHNVNGYAFGNTQLLSIARKGLCILQKDNPLFSGTIDLLCKNVRSAMQYAELISIHSLEARLAKTLINLTSVYPDTIDPDSQTIQPIPQRQLAMMINASRPKVNVKLREWVAAGFIKSHNRCISIVNEGALRNIARH